MKHPIVKILTPEKEVSNEWFEASFVRQEDDRLLAHIKYNKWSPEAKKQTKALMDSFDEPLYAFIHDTHHLKYLDKLGFVPTGRLVTCPYPGKEGQIFGEVVYIKQGIEQYCLESYKEEAEIYLPFEAIDGYGKIEAIESKLATLEEADWDTRHHFSDGVYTRETFIPKGTLLTGWRHKQTTVSVLASGVISVISVDKLGYATNHGVLKAPAVFVTAPDSKKIGFSHEDTVFVNSFNISEVDSKYHNIKGLEMIEEYIFDKEVVLCLE